MKLLCLHDQNDFLWNWFYLGRSPSTRHIYIDLFPVFRFFLRNENSK